ncbi:hypothetical protein GCM10027610_004330 [Dactylosporangium cerinum]
MTGPVVAAEAVFIATAVTAPSTATAAVASRERRRRGLLMGEPFGRERAICQLPFQIERTLCPPLFRVNKKPRDHRQT